MPSQKALMVFVLFTAVSTLVGCSHRPAVIPELLMREVDWTVTDGALMNAPQHYIGRVVILGGQVLKKDYSRDSTMIQVLQLPLNESKRPISTLRESQGLFVAIDRSTGPLAKLSPGAVVTIVGQVVQADRQGGSAVSGTAPRLHVKHLHVWHSTLEEEGRLSRHTSGGEGTEGLAMALCERLNVATIDDRYITRRERSTPSRSTDQPLCCKLACQAQGTGAQAGRHDGRMMRAARLLTRWATVSRQGTRAIHAAVP
jgi:starvation-inducible outer membrane lipoprotein